MHFSFQKYPVSSKLFKFLSSIPHHPSHKHLSFFPSDTRNQKAETCGAVLLSHATHRDRTCSQSCLELISTGTNNQFPQQTFRKNLNIKIQTYAVVFQDIKIQEANQDHWF